MHIIFLTTNEALVFFKYYQLGEVIILVIYV